MEINRLIYNKIIDIHKYNSNTYFYEYFEKFKNNNKYDIVNKIILTRNLIYNYFDIIKFKSKMNNYVNFEEELNNLYIEIYYLLKELKKHIDFQDETMLLMYYTFNIKNNKISENYLSYIFLTNKELWEETH